MNTFTAHASSHDADGGYCRKQVSEDELRLMTIGKLLRPNSKSLDNGKKIVTDFETTVEAQHRTSWESLGEVWQARNVLMHKFNWSKWCARTQWMVKG